MSEFFRDSPEAFTAKLNARYYICTLLLAGMSVFGWYAIYFLNANTILMEDGAPMSADVKMIFTVCLSVAVASWTLSFLVLLRQMIAGHAFVLDQNGIHSTVTAVFVLAFICIVPVKEIPYSAIESKEETDGLIFCILTSRRSLRPLFFAPLFAGSTPFSMDTPPQQPKKSSSICQNNP